MKLVRVVPKNCADTELIKWNWAERTKIFTSTTFRPDIEGLRALAVMLVLAFHHGWGSSFDGGFIGVDIFFVISGYLITKNIFTQAMNGNFSFNVFYIRRARRLFPALFFTITVTLGVGIVVTSPSDLQHIGESAIASIFSVSNFYFWSQSGYFDSAAIQKPLLHIWSLAVEEQFYLIWPIVVVLLVRFCKTSKSAVVSLMVLGVMSVCATEAAIGKDSSGAFYLMPYRIGEFAVGAICAWLPERSAIRGWICNVFAILGFGLIFYTVFRYTETTRFPGLMALVPCLGAALLIRFGENSITRHLLANSMAVGIGRISYSLYLVHWPVFVFLRQLYVGDPGIGKALTFSAISVIIAIFMYQYIEQPFRIQSESAKISFISTRGFMKLFSCSTVCLIIISLIIWFGDGWTWRYPSDLTRFAKEAVAEKNARSDLFRERCLAKDCLPCDKFIAGINVLIVGDSHALDAFNAFATQYPQYHYIFNGLAGCPPLVREDNNLLTIKHPNRDGCIERNEKLLYSDQMVKADIVVINTVFSWYKPEHLERSIIQIRKKTSAPIIVLGNYMFFKEDVPDMVIRHGVRKMNAYYEKNLVWHSFAFDDELEALATKLNFTYISKRELLCQGDSISECPLIFDNKLFTYDRHHFSMAAAKNMGFALKARCNEIFIGIENQKMIGRNSETYH